MKTQTRALAIMTAVAIAICAVLIYTSSKSRSQTVELTGYTTAKALAEQVATLRTIYTQEVVARAKQAGMNVNYDFQTATNTLPLPATMVKFLGQAIEKEFPGSKIRLYSRFPFPHRKQFETYDKFEQEALEAVEKNPKQPFYRIEELNGKRVMRYVSADLLRLPCVNCHNTHPESPKRDWKVGDVRGAVEVIVPVSEVDLKAKEQTLQVAGFSLGGVALLLVVAMVFLRRVEEKK